VAEKLIEFLELFYEATVNLSCIYYPTSPLIMYNILEITSIGVSCHGTNYCSLGLWKIWREGEDIGHVLQNKGRKMKGGALWSEEPSGAPSFNHLDFQSGLLFQEDVRRKIGLRINFYSGIDSQPFLLVISFGRFQASPLIRKCGCFPPIRLWWFN
jgi:hypothetical protein